MSFFLLDRGLVFAIARIEFVKRRRQTGRILFADSNQRMQVEGCDRGAPDDCRDTTDDDVFDFVSV